MSTAKKKSEVLEFLEKAANRNFTLGGYIESIRLGEDLTQPAFAKLLKISKSHLNDIEKGRKAVSPGRAARYANTLGYSPEQFVRLSLQAILDHEGVEMIVNVESA